MRRAILPLIVLAAASSAYAAEGDVHTYPFECDLVGTDGEKRSITGMRIETESSFNYRPTIRYSFEITDRGVTRTTDFYRNHPKGNLEPTFEIEAPEDGDQFRAPWHYESYAIDWHSFPNPDDSAPITVRTWYELRPAVRMGITQTASGYCKYVNKSASK